jgi:hypothetical protein
MSVRRAITVHDRAVLPWSSVGFGRAPTGISSTFDQPILLENVGAGR